MLNILTLNKADENKADGRIYQVLIDGVPLLEMFREYEAQFSDSINGAYTDALSEMQLRQSLSKKGLRFMPLGCDCGEFECWFVTGEVLTYDDYVSWGRWENPYRDKRDRKDEGLFWSYKGFPDIVFEARQYQQAIEQALAP